MFEIDRTTNRIAPIKERSFSELNFREREHLQEWVANLPEALGEELLIIQKEFDGFDETRERLDLLALDKDGRLVVIENKLDDTGRDVVWQALKYAAYVSSLTRTQIIDIYQQYLDRYCGGGNAAENISSFLDEAELSELVLNQGYSQRVIFIAANFRKEVTSTALWLLGKGIQVQCFKTTIYTFGDQLLLDLRQIIPTPEAEEFMIGMSSKEHDEKSAVGDLKKGHKLRLEYWERALSAFREAGITTFQNISPGKDHWLNAGSGVGGAAYALIFGKDEVRVELCFQRSSKEQNKWLFDQLKVKQEEIEDAFGADLNWLRLDDKKASRITASCLFDGYNRENWPEMIEWQIDHLRRLEKAMRAPLQALAGQLPDDL